ncbi:MAG: hypothetical protein KDI46_01230 [Alphaproteobacteria bacterium]|nr:hypothetical protein [Alphaproteobacteria bacterium]
MDIEAVKHDNRPIVLDMRFDPGWKSQRLNFQARAADRLQRPHNAPQKFSQKPHIFPAYSTAEFLQISAEIRSLRPLSLQNRGFVSWESDLYRYPNIVLGRNAQKIIALKNAFHIAGDPGNTPRSPRMEMLDAIDPQNPRRITAFPCLLYSYPSKDTKNGGKGETGVLFDKGFTLGSGSKDHSGNLVYSPTIQTQNQRIRERITSHDLVAVFAMPRIRMDQASEQMDMIFGESDPVDQFFRLTLRVTNDKQIATDIPAAMLHI